MPETIILVDDDDLFRESLAQNLEDAGFIVRAFPSGPVALDKIPSGPGDLIILDWKMPEMTGIEVLRRLRETGDGRPVLFLTTLSDQIFEEAALSGGAVDFVEKSRSFGILMKRLRLILGGSKGQAAAEAAAGPAANAGTSLLELGPLSLDLDGARARWRGQPVELTLTEFRIVEHLARRAGRDQSYRALYDVVHGEGFVAGSGADGFRTNVRSHMKRIRQKFRDLDPGFDEIMNYAGFGYAWRPQA